MRIGTLVSTIRLRHPTFLAAQVITVDQISGGRAIVGIGAGEPEQNTMLGDEPWPAKEAMERLDEQAVILATLLRGRPVTSTGPYYPTTVEAMPVPIARPGPPLVIAAHGPMGIRATARSADVWNCFGGQVYAGGPRPDPSTRRSLAEAVAETERLMAKVDEACHELGRDPRSLGRSVLAYRPAVDPFASLDAFDDFVGAYSHLPFDEMILYWPPLDPGPAPEARSAEAEARFERIAAQRIGSRSSA
jgi:alkanesulfonate monooxygenase SsuD/methylene tetrahydromethanopterin reductase-like flavin-dependent oxidoreductase (luciferase family)